MRYKYEYTYNFVLPHNKYMLGGASYTESYEEAHKHASPKANCVSYLFIWTYLGAANEEKPSANLIKIFQIWVGDYSNLK